MMITSHIGTATRQLMANKGKSFLTMLGIIIGIGSVILIMTLGEIAKNFLLSQITQFGTNVVEVFATSSVGISSSSTEEDVTFTLDDIRELENSSLLSDMTGISAAYIANSTLSTKETESMTISVWGDIEQVFKVNNLDVLSGRQFTNLEVKRADRVAVLSKKEAEDIFETTANAIGKTVSIGGRNFSVVGVVADIPFGGGPMQSGYVYVPLTTVYELLAPPEDRNIVTAMIVQFDPNANAENFKNRLVYELVRIKKLSPEQADQIYAASREQFTAIFDSVLGGIQLFVAAIAAISLFVGGIGIMNIMLVTVNERTKEIGLRKAVGAKNRSILFQFLIEAAVLTTVGGFIGIAGGLGTAYAAVFVVNLVQPDWSLQFMIVPIAIILACAVSMTTGFIFGLYPAIKAAKLHPIEALRYE